MENSYLPVENYLFYLCCFSLGYLSYDLVSRGTDTSGSNQCYGTHDDSTGTGTGGGYTYACIRSGTIENIDANTVWYNYALASAGTITGTSNTTNATQSVCPKGWTLPNKVQSDSIAQGGSGGTRYVSIFSPVLGGSYQNGNLPYTSTRGYWWGSKASDGISRYTPYYDGNLLYTGEGGRRYFGYYIRCVSSS